MSFTHPHRLRRLLAVGAGIAHANTHDADVVGAAGDLFEGDLSTTCMEETGSEVGPGDTLDWSEPEATDFE